MLINDCCRGVDLVDIEKTKQTVVSSNGIIAQSHEVWHLLSCFSDNNF